ncbi:MAG TPA: hypothetical protein VF024_12155 [Solirubrobacteraceae bacterium]
MSDAYEWREHSSGEWWHDQTGPRKAGVAYPPDLWVGFAADDAGRPLEEGCLHLYSLYNGAMPHEGDEDDVDYLHVCGREGLDGLIEALTDLRARLYPADGR